VGAAFAQPGLRISGTLGQSPAPAGFPTLITAAAKSGDEYLTRAAEFLLAKTN